MWWLYVCNLTLIHISNIEVYRTQMSQRNRCFYLLYRIMTNFCVLLLIFQNVVLNIQCTWFNITEILYFTRRVYWYLFQQRELSIWSYSLRISIFCEIVPETMKIVWMNLLFPRLSKLDNGVNRTLRQST